MADERTRLTEAQDKLSLRGAMYDAEVEKLLRADLYKRLVSVGLFDRMEVSNSTESVGYIASPNDFLKCGHPFEEDPIDDAKALIASLTSPFHAEAELPGPRITPSRWKMLLS